MFALSRNPESPAAKALVGKGVQVLKGDFTDKASLEAALKECKPALVFLVTDFWNSAKQDEDTEFLHGANMIDAVNTVDPSIFFLFSSVGDADAVPPELHHFVSKSRIEKHLAESLQRWAVIRPGMCVYTCILSSICLMQMIICICRYLDNFDDAATFNPLTKGQVKGLFLADQKVKMIAVADIGKAAANVLAKPTTFEGQVLELSTCEHTGTEIAEALTQVSGVSCSYSVVFSKFFMRMLIPDIYNMVLWLENNGYSADLEKARELVGPDVMDAKTWFEYKGQWANGEKFGTEAELPAREGFFLGFVCCATSAEMPSETIPEEAPALDKTTEPPAMEGEPRIIEDEPPVGPEEKPPAAADPSPNDEGGVPRIFKDESPAQETTPAAADPSPDDEVPVEIQLDEASTYTWT